MLCVGLLPKTKCIERYRLSKEEKEVSEKPKQASSVVNLILPEVNEVNQFDI